MHGSRLHVTVTLVKLLGKENVAPLALLIRFPTIITFGVVFCEVPVEINVDPRTIILTKGHDHLQTAIHDTLTVLCPHEDSHT